MLTGSRLRQILFNWSAMRISAIHRQHGFIKSFSRPFPDTPPYQADACSEDTGIGIPEAQQQAVFEGIPAASRGKSACKLRRHGAGLDHHQAPCGNDERRHYRRKRSGQRFALHGNLPQRGRPTVELGKLLAPEDAASWSSAAVENPRILVDGRRTAQPGTCGGLTGALRPNTGSNQR